MTSASGRFPTDSCSRRILSTSARLRVFPSIAFVPQVFSAPARFQTPSGTESSAVRVSSSWRRVPSMSCLIGLIACHTTYLSLYGLLCFDSCKPYITPFAPCVASVGLETKWTGWDLNPRPLPCQDSDLPADLPAQQSASRSGWDKNIPWVQHVSWVGPGPSARASLCSQTVQASRGRGTSRPEPRPDKWP